MTITSTKNYDDSYLEVYIWLGKDKYGNTTTSLKGGVDAKLGFPAARCGHVSMEIFPQGINGRYVSLWHAKKPLTARLQASFDDDMKDEHGLPDAIIRLHQMNIPKMLKAIDDQKKRVENNEIVWDFKVSDHNDVTDGHSKASCASFVYTFLKIGGLNDKKSIYYENEHKSGPRNHHFYKITKCNAGDILGGYFNGWFFLDWDFSPKAMLLRAASAAEATDQDKTATTQIMSSTRVATEKTSYFDVAASAIGITAVAVGGIALKHVMKK